MTDWTGPKSGANRFRVEGMGFGSACLRILHGQGSAPLAAFLMQAIIIVCMGAAATASIGHLFLGLLRELNRREERGRNR
jgi:hypothetical protein